ncbi:MAG: thioredoxin [Clostridia bacterium]|nr:thioredoxin [Clostridia bacterium]
MSVNVKEVNTDEFRALVKGDKPVVCDFWATWCGPCRMMAPVLDEVAGELADKAVFVKVDTDEEAELAMEYRIASIPCIKVFKNGEEADENIGFTPKDELKAFVENAIK